MRSFSATEPIELSAVSIIGAPLKTRRILISIIILYYLPSLLILGGFLPFVWRFQLLATMTAVMLAYDLWHNISLRELGFRKDTLKGSLLLHTVTSTLLAVCMYLTYSAGLIRTPTIPSWKLFFVYYLFISSPSQEFLFRSNFFALMCRSRFSGPALQIVASAITYSFLHIIYKDALILLTTFVIGLLWGWIYHKYPNFWGAAFSHAVLGTLSILFGII